MKVIAENGCVRFIPSSPKSEDEKKAISRRITERFACPVSHKIEPPNFCFSCNQAIVEVKDQSCPACIRKIINAQKGVTVRPSLLIGIVMGGVCLAVLFVTWVLPLFR